MLLVPLLSLAVDARAGTAIAVDVAGPIAEITLHRQFRNEGDRPIDAELFLPVPAGGGIDGLTVRIGSREIRSRVLPAEESMALFREAASAGRAATLTEDHDDVLVQHVANVMPGEDVDVELRLVVPVERSEGAWQLRLPLTLTPRFDDDLDLIHAIPPEASAGLPPWVERSVRPEDRADIDVVVHASAPVRWIESRTHPFHSRIDREQAELWIDDAPMDRDLVIRWATSLPDPAVGLLVSDGHGLLTIEAPAPWAPLSPGPADVVLLVDASDSMIGSRSAAVPDIVEALLRRLRPDDRVTVLRFSDTVRGLAVREPPEAVAALPAALRTARIGGGSELADGLRLAMAVPAPPERHVSVVLITDGGYGDEPRLSEIIAARPGVVVHTVGVGSAPNLGLLGRIAAQTGGLSLAVPPEGSAEEALRPLGAGLAGPLLTDVAIDWGAHLSAEPAPKEVPPLYADQAVHVGVRGVSCDGGPVTIRGQLSGRPWAVEVEPECVDAARPLAVLWAKRRLAGPMSSHQRVELSVAYQVPGPGTLLVGVDSGVVNPGGDAVAQQEAVPLPDDYALGGGVYLLDGALAPPVLETIPAGRSYQTFVMPGSIPITIVARWLYYEDGAGNGRTVLLDDADITDPVAGTFVPPLAAAFDGTRWFGVYRPPEMPGGGSVVSLSTRSGRNNVDGRFGLDGLHVGPEPLAGGTVRADLGGPLIRDRLWLRTSVWHTERAVAGIDNRVSAGSAQLSAALGGENRLSLFGAVDPSSLTLGDQSEHYGGGLSTLRFSGRLAPDATVEASAAALARRVGPTARERQSLAAAISASPERHELALGASASRWGWRGPDLRFDASAVSAYAQDEWKPTDALALSGGLRMDALPSERRLLPSPRLRGQIGERTSLALGYARSFDIDRLLPASLAEEPRIPRTDSLSAAFSQELDDLRLTARGVQRWERFPFAPAPELAPGFGTAPSLERAISSIELEALKFMSRRWHLELSWRFSPNRADSPLVASPAAPWVPGFLEPYRRHRFEASAAWDLPTDPYIQSIGGSLRWASPVFASGAPQWWLRQATVASAFVRQRIAMRRGALALEASLSYAVNDAGATLLPLEVVALLPNAPAIDERPPLWGQVGLEYDL